MNQFVHDVYDIFVLLISVQSLKLVCTLDLQLR